MILRRAQPTESREVREWIIAHHYLKSAPPGYREALEFLDGGRRIGAMLLGRPTSRRLDSATWLELTRMYFVDDTESNVESHALGKMRRHVRIWLPEIRGIIAYSDPSVGHNGTIYKADGWACLGLSDSAHASWRSRPNRKEHQRTPKLRWVRTP